MPYSQQNGYGSSRDASEAYDASVAHDATVAYDASATYSSDGAAYSYDSGQGPASGDRRSSQSLDDAAIKRMMKGSNSGFLDRYGNCAVTFVLIAINVAVFVVEVVASGFSPNIDSMTLINMGAMFAPIVQSAADLYRFVTPMFLHLDVMHLLFNMAALYSVGIMLESFLGRWNYLLLYFVAGITGNVVSYLVDMSMGTLVVSAGASTSIFGLFVAAAVLGVLSKGNRHVLQQYSKGFLGVIVINIVYTLMMPGISMSGHLGGAIGGLIAMFMIPSRNLRVPNAMRAAVAVLWIAAIGYVLASQGVIF